MGLFGFGKKKKTVKNRYHGELPVFTSYEELPDDVWTLIKMYRHYNDRGVSEVTYQIDRKLLEVDQPPTYFDAYRHMAERCFTGDQRPKDLKEGSRLFLIWFDHVLQTAASPDSILHAIRDYFYWGFWSCDHIIEQAEKRIQADIASGGDPIGMFVYEHFKGPWQHEALAELLNIRNMNTKRYFAEYRDNIAEWDADFYIMMIENDSRSCSNLPREAQQTVEQAAMSGDLLALSYMTNQYVGMYQPEHSRYSEFTAMTARIYEKMRALVPSHDHQKEIEKKRQLETALQQFTDLFSGHIEALPANYSFRTDEGGFYGQVKQLFDAYEALRRGERSKRDAFERAFEYIALRRKHYPAAVYRKLLICANGYCLPYGFFDVGPDRIREDFAQLLQANYAPALRMQTEVDDETRKLALTVRCNPTLQRSEFEAAHQTGDFTLAIRYLYDLVQMGEAAPYIHLKNMLLRSSVLKELEIFERQVASKKRYCEWDETPNFTAAAFYFNEPVASFYEAIVYHDFKKEYLLAKKSAQAAVAYLSHSAFDLTEEFKAKVFEVERATVADWNRVEEQRRKVDEYNRRRQELIEEIDERVGMELGGETKEWLEDNVLGQSVYDALDDMIPEKKLV